MASWSFPVIFLVIKTYLQRGISVCLVGEQGVIWLKGAVSWNTVSLSSKEREIVENCCSLLWMYYSLLIIALLVVIYIVTFLQF